MGFVLSKEELDVFFDAIRKDSRLYGPKRFVGKGEYSDTDSIRYDDINSVGDLELEVKSQFTFKEILIPISETILFFTEDSVREANSPNTKETYVFLRSCDLHAVKRLDNIYLNNGFEDYYYKRLRDKVKFVLIGCPNSFDSCFCVDMGTNKSEDYSMSIDLINDEYHMDVKDEKLEKILKEMKARTMNVTPQFVEETKTRVEIVEDLDPALITKHELWNEYDSRCIACGRCNFSCPTCTCYTMQDIFYRDNGKVGERKRVWASCMVDGFTKVAGGGEYRKKHGQRMRFKALHKVYDYKKKFKDHHMCTGCGRCDDVCPEYISFSNEINKIAKAMKEEV